VPRAPRVARLPPIKPSRTITGARGDRGDTGRDRTEQALPASRRKPMPSLRRSPSPLRWLAGRDRWIGWMQGCVQCCGVPRDRGDAGKARERPDRTPGSHVHHLAALPLVPSRPGLTDSTSTNRGGWPNQSAAEAYAHGCERGLGLLAWECSHPNPARIALCASDGIASAFHGSLCESGIPSASDLEDNGTRHLRDLHATLGSWRTIRAEASTGFAPRQEHAQWPRVAAAGAGTGEGTGRGRGDGGCVGPGPQTDGGFAPGRDSRDRLLDSSQRHTGTSTWNLS
jgi:hypothetical protein